jgi:hypothetical protein
MTTPITILSAGLSLSRALRARGIPFALYDRSSTPARHAYTIYLATETWRPLCRVLDVEEAVLRRRVGVSIAGQGDGVGTGGEGRACACIGGGWSSFCERGWMCKAGGRLRVWTEEVQERGRWSSSRTVRW